MPHAVVSRTVVVAALAAVVAGGGVLGVGCKDPPTQLACASDAQCPLAQACVEGACVARAQDECPAVAPPAAQVHVVDGAAGADVCDARVVVNGVEVAANTECRYVGGGAGGDSVDVSVVRFNFAPFVTSVDVEEDACGPVTAQVTAALAAVPDACVSDDDCNGDGGPVACVLRTSEDRAVCEAGRGGVGNGFGCDFDDDCVHGACTDHVCSGACRDDEDCARGLQTCAPSDVLAGASTCATQPLLPLPCTTSFDCAGEGGVCGGIDIVSGGLVCTRPLGTDPKGAVCHDEGTSDTCGGGLCDDVDDGRCTLACASDEDCVAQREDDVATLCTNIGIDGVDARACFAPCDAQAACGSRACRARVDAIADAIVFACDGARGLKEPGEPAASGAECATNFSAFDAGGAARFCSAPCASDDDCASAVALMRCAAVTLPRPVSGGAQEVAACVVVAPP